MISKKRRNLIFLEALLLTLSIYSFAFFFNNYLDTQRFEQLNINFGQSNLNFYSYEISEIFYNNFNSTTSNNFCKNKKIIIFKNFAAIKQLGVDINNYGKLFSKENLNFSKNKQRQYFLDQFSIYISVIKYNKECKNKKIFPVLYFFNGNDVSLDKQSLIIEQFVLNNKNKSITFSFDVNYNNEPIIQKLKKQYNISFTPFIVLNKKTTKDLKNINHLVDLNTISVEYKKFRGII